MTGSVVDSRWSFDFFVGFRFGEAKHPRPAEVSLAVINPTTVLHKAGEILSLGVGVVLASETAATRAVQSQMGYELRLKGIQTVWGCARKVPL